MYGNIHHFRVQSTQASFTEKTILSLLNHLCAFVENQLLYIGLCYNF